VQLLNAAMQHQANCRARESTAAYTCLVLLNRAGPTGARQFNKKEAGIAKTRLVFYVKKKREEIRLCCGSLNPDPDPACLTSVDSGSLLLVLKNFTFKGNKI
jgi:hypothetical protein